MLQNLVAVKPHIPLIKFRKGLSEPTSVITGGVVGSAPIVVGSVAAPVAGGSLDGGKFLPSSEGKLLMIWSA